MAATLYAVPASHPCACVERALQLKRIEYRRIDLPPVAHKPVQYVRFGGGTVPGLVLDGEKILGSRRIVRALEERLPEPPLLPADEKERKSVELAEEWGDEVLQPLVRRAIWVALRRSPASLPSYGEGSRLSGRGWRRVATTKYAVASTNSTIEVHTLNRRPPTSCSSTGSIRRYSIQPRPIV